MLNKRNYKERIDFWSNHIKKWKENNLSQAEYSRRGNISKQQLSKRKVIIFRFSILIDVD